MTKSFKQLLADWQAAAAGTEYPTPPAYDGPDVILHNLVEHTAAVKPGVGFVARVRAGSDGHPYINEALEKGANLIIGQRPLAELDVKLPAGVPYLQVENSALTYAWLWAAWYGFPARDLTTIGVTGTDGKSTTVALIFAILQAAGYKAGMLSTIKAVLDDVEEPLALHVTTPEAPVVQGYLRRMVEAGITHCVLETTSHGLAQERVSAIPFQISAVTNITHEHLDYHGSYEAYLAAKSRLFHNLTVAGWPMPAGRPRAAVLNRDDASYQPLDVIAAPRKLTYGLGESADVRAVDVRLEPSSSAFTLYLPARDNAAGLPIHSPLVGDFNVYNMLAAAAVGEALGLPAGVIKTGLEGTPGISGRMEPIDRGQPFAVIVDFAHTHISLEKAIKAARSMSDGRVIAVFGSAGKRDVKKRWLMGEVSARDANLTILTAEDPRTESLDDILAAMAEGCRQSGGIENETFWRIPDRGRAIYFALTLAQADDLILICGKGHEQSMCFGEREYPWDDREATRAALDAFLAGAPMPDLGLPTFS